VCLHSLHASTLTEVPWKHVREREHERFFDFDASPDAGSYLSALDTSLADLSRAPRVQAVVLSLGYDTVAGDPHGSWSFQPEVFARIGRMLAASGLPVCVVQEGGYALESLAACGHAFATGLLGEQDAGAPLEHAWSAAR